MKKKVQINKETCKIYGKAILLGGAYGFATTFETAAVIAAWITPGLTTKDRLAFTAANAAAFGLGSKGYVAELEHLLEESRGLTWKPFEFVDGDPLEEVC